MRANPIRNAFLAIAVLVTIGAVVLLRGYSIQFTRADDAEQGERQAKATTAQIAKPAATSADDILKACKSDPDVLRKAGISCAVAAKTKAAIADADTTVTAGPAGTDGRNGPAGDTGARGPGPSTNQVAAAIRAYCAANGDCKGPTGSAGQTGQAGATGPAGKDSTAPGPQGPSGPPGSDGQDGRGIQSATCGDDGRWTVTYTDGTSADAGECRASILP